MKLKNPINIFLFILMVMHIARVRPDIVMTFFPLSNILGVIASRLAGSNTIISTRRDYGLWLNKWRIYPLRFANMFVKRIITNSNKVKELVSVEEKFDSSRIDVICNGLEVGSFNERVKNNQS